MSDRELMASAMDDWCRKRCDRLKGPMHAYIKKGGNLNDPQYRQQLGQHQAYMAMRSYIHGSLRATK